MGTPSFNPATGLFIWLADYDTPLEEQVRKCDPGAIAWATSIATDRHFPDDRKGKKVLTGRVIDPDKEIGHGELERTAGGPISRPKDYVGFLKAFPLSLINEYMPMVCAGQFWVNPDDGFRYCLYADCLVGELGLRRVWLHPSGVWDGHWRFLVIWREQNLGTAC